MRHQNVRDGVGSFRKRSDETRLSNAGFTRDEHDLTLTVDCLRQRRVERGDRILALHDVGRQGGPWWCRGGGLESRSSRRQVSEPCSAWICLDVHHVANETVTAPGHRFDESWRRRRIIEREPNLPNRHLYHSVADVHPWPDGAEQLFFCHESATALQQTAQHAKGLRCERPQLGGTPETLVQQIHSKGRKDNLL